ncbi:hypothetical protein CASFOL_027766 [Castilleja foliolosa]|uniref:Uncharacterized protein n=1 Tax=Castilleja foliolosa TaxID=1961234 RepID=A0ABD3CIZ7_9LAMI
MAIKGVFKWYDGFFLSMLATSVYPFNECSRLSKGYLLFSAVDIRCTYGVDYTTVFVFRLLMFADNGLASGMGLDLGWQQRYAPFVGRIFVLSILVLLLYPFLLTWTVIGTLWFTHAKDFAGGWSEVGFSYLAAFQLLRTCVHILHLYGKVVNKRQAHLLHAQQGIPVSEYGVLVDLVRVPDWAIEAAGQEMRGMGQDAAAYEPGLYLSPAQREAVEALIQELPKFKMKAVTIDSRECPICLEEFHVGSWSPMCTQFLRGVHRRVAPIKREMPEMSLLGLSEPGPQRIVEYPDDGLVLGQCHHDSSIREKPVA